jgi:ATP-dependent DNA helicase RecG
MDDHRGNRVVEPNRDFNASVNIRKMNLADPVTKLPLIGPKYQKLLKKLNIATVEDLLHHYPARYEDFSRHKKINELIYGQTATVRGTVLEIKNIYTKNRKRLTKAVIADETGQLDVIWFNQPYLTRNIKKNDTISLSGSLGNFNHRPTLINPEYEVTTTTGGNVSRPTIHTGRLVPIYPETRGISSKWLRSRINHALKSSTVRTGELFTDLEFLPEPIRRSRRLIDLSDALNQIHFPQSQKKAEQARRRLAFDELFLLQLQALKKRRDWQQKPLAHRVKIKNQESKIKKFIDSLPFKLTNAQKRAVDEILKDLQKDVPMNRLLEGDVGSGKTVVAAVAMYATHLNGLQSVLMAPTEVLAEQHYKEVKKMLEPFGVRIALRTGSKKTSTLRSQLSTPNSPLSILIGTHALLYDDSLFNKLGLIIIDEQHRFGVEQRAKLLRKGTETPHLLTMTATPIPRSMALTIYGDLDLSVIDEMPPGRMPVKTWVVPNRKRQNAYDWIQKQVRRNRAQAFIIYPLIEESTAETMQDVKAATAEFERLSQEIFPDLKLALLHGRIKSDKKNQILAEFARGNYDILVATQVVEVGIDIPNATIMVVEGADRFGLASLHQLRGRVGRSDRESFCFLFSQSRSPKVYQRLRAMEQINDGFKLAKIDLKMRGPGQIYGTAQHGIPELKIARLNDLKLIETTRQEAKTLIEKNPNLANYPHLKAKLGRMSSELVEPN